MRIILISVILSILTWLNPGLWAADGYVSNTVDDSQQVLVERYIVTDTRGNRFGSVKDFDSTNQYVFIVYSENSTVIDAYDMAGNYVFSLSFQSKEKGSISIRCEDNLLYVSTKYHNVFIFDGKKLVNQMNSEAAEKYGYNFRWFNEKQRNLELVGFTLFKLDSDGNRQFRVYIPMDVIWCIYSRYIPIVVISVVMVACFIRAKIKNKKTITGGN